MYIYKTNRVVFVTVVPFHLLNHIIPNYDYSQCFQFMAFSS